MAQLFFCTVSKVNYENATADIAITERENMLKTDVPILDTVYDIPNPGETVVALFDEEAGRIQRGVVLGRPYHEAKVMKISAQTVRVRHLEAESVVYHNSCEKG